MWGPQAQVHRQRQQHDSGASGVYWTCSVCSAQTACVLCMHSRLPDVSEGANKWLKPSLFIWAKFIFSVDNVCSQLSIGKTPSLLFLFVLVLLLPWKWLLIPRWFMFAWSPAWCLAQSGFFSWAVGFTGKAECLLTSPQVSYCCTQWLMEWESANYVPRWLERVWSLQLDPRK